MDLTHFDGPLDANQLEDLLAEIGRQILDQGVSSVDSLGANGAYWGCTRVSVELGREGMDRMIGAGACRVGVCNPNPTRVGELATYIDHTLLKPDATAREIDALCGDALENGFASVCVNGCWVRRASEILSGSSVLVCSVIGFPLGAMASEVKAYEARRALEDGACEIDMVVNVGALKGRDHDFVRRDIATVAETVHRLGGKLKVILETCLLTDDEKVHGCELAKQAGADFVKTSTGFSTGGATLEDVALMRRTVGPTMGVKASGGVRDGEGARAMIEAGATRIGASASIEIVRGGAASGSGY